MLVKFDLAFFVKREDVVRLRLGTIIPGEPIGIPGTPSPAKAGFSFKILSISSAGTWPSMT